ncbi:hypothetical protein [Streptomyces sp. NPDC002324]
MVVLPGTIEQADSARTSVTFHPSTAVAPPSPRRTQIPELNEMGEQWDRQDDARRIGPWSRTIAEDFALEQPLLMPLPEEPFETGRIFTPKVDRYGQIPVRSNRSSIPIRLIGKRGLAATLEAGRLD